jgi:HSP20 family molecular chaperone IbpA
MNTSLNGTGSGTGSQSSLDKDKKFKVEVDIEDFKPEDLMVKTVDKKLIISARREEKIGSRSSTKELNREFQLPETVEPTSVKCYFNDSGKLLIEAPYRLQIQVGHYSEGRDGSPVTGR